MATFRAGGIFSGLDSNSIIEQLMAIERVPVTQLQKRQATLTSQKSLLGSIQSSLSGLKSSVGQIDTEGELLAYQATSSNETALTVSASGTAMEGEHTVKVLQTARAEQDRSQAYSSASEVVGPGELVITPQGEDPVTITLEAGGDLADLAWAINAESEARVTATIINDGTQVYLNLCAKDTGHVVGEDPDEAIVLSGDLATSLGFTQVIQAQNAAVEFDSLRIERRTNSLTDVTPGLTMNVHDATGQPTVVVTVTPDSEELKSRLQSFIDSYNKVVSLVRSQFVYVEGQSPGVLFGDGTLQNLLGQVQMAISERVTGVTGSFSTLGSVGISTSSDGTLSIDESEFEDAVAKDFRGIADLFTTEDTGLCTRLEEIVDRFTNSVDGAFRYKLKGLQDRYDNLTEQIDRMELRLSAYEQNLVSQFTYLESVISQLKSQQGSLASLS